MMHEFCPLCHKNGYKRRIKLSQLNLQEAVWLCESSECPWPFGYEDFTFVSRKIGETWSSEWELRRPTTSKSSETHQISLNELGLDTPPVTPGSGSEVIHKDSVFVENTCSPSLSLSPNSVGKTKGTHHGPKHSKCESIDSGVSDENKALAPLGANRSIRKEETRPNLKNDFSLVDDLNFEGLDKRLESSQGFNEACDAAEALTPSIFNVGKPSSDNKLSGLYDNANCHESTVKCNKWLSDNTKSTVVVDHCYSSSESSRWKQERTENSSGKKLPRVKSIKKTNLKLVRSNSTCSEASSVTSILILNDFDKKDEGNKIPTMDGSFLINSSDEAPSFVGTCVTVPWNTEYQHPQNEMIVRIDPKPEPVVDNNPVILIKIKAEDLKSIRGTKIIQSPKNPDIQAHRKSDHRLHEMKLKPEPVADNESVGIKLEHSEDTRAPKTVHSARKVDEKKIEALANPSDIQETKPCTTSDKNQMKKPHKRAFPKTAKYQGFNFGSLKKCKRNSSNIEEGIKSSLPNLPSPDNASTCSEATCGSECSYATATTVDSKLDNNSKSLLDSEDVSLASSSDAKTSSGPQADSISDANLNSDLQVLDDLMLCNNVGLPQDFNDDWLVSLFE